MRMPYSVSSKMMRKILVRDLNRTLTCRLCTGYLIDATTLTDCNHTYCRGCILRYFENCKTGCPDPDCKKKCPVSMRSDPQLQAMVYKLVPGLYSKEMQRRDDFYRSTGLRASSSCSDDSVLERERDIMEQDAAIASYIGDRNQFFGPEDSISLSLEFYDQRLDKTNPNEDWKSRLQRAMAESETTLDKEETKKENKSESKSENNSAGGGGGDKHKLNGSKDPKDAAEPVCEGDGGVGGKRSFLQCPAAVHLQHLQKFIRMKFALTENHKVDIIYEGEVLPDHFTLMDVAYTFMWLRTKPMRFFYRIFTPMKVQPIKIVNTTLSTGGKQLQIVPLKHETKISPPPPPSPQLPPPPPPPKPAKPHHRDHHHHQQQQQQQSKDEPKKQPEDNNNHREKGTKEEKERLLAHLQLQSKSKSQTPTVQKSLQDCVFDYEEPDREEIKRFAEIRDREWAMQKRLDEGRSKGDDEDHHHFSKKRKKNKHSKNDIGGYKKRKLHAEITSKDASEIEDKGLKLKVKLTHNNGHKHKHHRSAGSSSSTPELSSKEKLLQMRQVRHKHIASEDKTVQVEAAVAAPAPKEKIAAPAPKEKITAPAPKEKIAVQKIAAPAPKEKIAAPAPKEKVAVPLPAPAPKEKTAAPAPKEKKEVVKLEKVGPDPVPSLTMRIGVDEAKKEKTFAVKSKEWVSRVPKVHLERNEATEQQAKKTFLKTYQSYADSFGNIKKKELLPPPQKRQSLLDSNIANLQQRCTVEAKPSIPKPAPPKPPLPKPAMAKPAQPSQPAQKITHQYPPGFTVSKVESGIKRKADGEDKAEKRPSLEITLINPPAQQQLPVEPPKPAKRPLPQTIPLDRIKKTISLAKTGLSIIPKEKLDVAPLDLSKKDESPVKTNGFYTEAPGLINLNMLSNVAMQHPSLDKAAQAQGMAITKPRTQVPPNLPTLNPIKIPGSSNMAKIPKLNEIGKSHFMSRMTSPIRNLRPNQNQNIRNIPNPSLVVRQQNQNRLNSINSSKEVGRTSAGTTSGGVVESKSAEVVVTKSIEAGKEIAV